MGYVIEFYEEQQCYSYIVVPGSQLLNDNFLGFCYLIGLGWLFVGIAIVSDIFMESIEMITSQTKVVQLYDNKSKNIYLANVPIWNATIANLTLMALGSSAPEILLSVIETVKDLDAEPGELGPSTIVGSAAFNLLVISGLSILAVGEEPKKIFDVGVFAVTSVASLFAYIWMYLVLQDCNMERDVVTMVEAWLTFAYFAILVVVAFAADRFNAYLEDQKKTQEDIDREEEEKEIQIKKSKLKTL